MINEIILIIYILIGLTPGINSRMTLVLLLFLLIALSFFGSKKTLKGVVLNKYNIVIYIWILYNFFLKAIGFSTAPVGNYFIMITFYFSLILFRILKRKSKDFILKVIYFSETCILVNLLTNVYYSLKNPGIVEKMNFDIFLKSKYINLGNTNFSFVILLFSLIAYYKFLKFKTKKSLSIVIIGVFYIYLVSKTTSLILLLVFIVKISLDYFLKKNILLKTYFASTLLMIVILLKNSLINFLVDFLDNTYITKRLLALQNISFDNQFLGRIRLGFISLESFIKNPLLGLGYVKVDLSQGLGILKSVGIGHHSEVLDHLGRFGIIGAIFVFCIFKHYYNEIYISKYKILINNLFQALFCYSVLNNSFSISISILFFIYFPLTLMQLDFEEKCFNNKKYKFKMRGVKIC